MGKSIDYLRLSLTDRCNLNCIYCTPLEKNHFLSRQEVLSYEEMARVVSLFVKAGVRKLRLTGGEPLIKKNITGLVKMLKGIEGLKEIAMTTNGVGLKDLALPLKDAGLDRINISIDTLDKEKFQAITGFDCFESVWHGIEQSLFAGFAPVKLNVILMRGINDNEVSDFARLIFDYPLIVRFIEYFTTNSRSCRLSQTFIESREIKKRISVCFGKLGHVSGITGNGPAQYYKLQGAKGSIGFISGSSGNFCDNCNRIRLDCAGRICPCLFSRPTHDLRPLLRGGYSQEELLNYIKDVFKIKSGYRKDISMSHELEMSSIGG